jgi:hypothetical protein
MTRRIRIACIVAVLTMAGCDGLLYQPAPREPARLAIAAYIQAASMGGAAEAYARADRLFVRFRNGTDVRFEQDLPFDATGAETRVPIQVPLRDATETLVLELELRMGAQPLFSGGTVVELTAGRAAEIEVPLQPIIARVQCTGAQVELASYGEVVQLTGAALFATNDTVRNTNIVWSVSPANIVSIGNTTGVVTALQDGTATVTCAAAGMTDTRAVRVLAVVRTIDVTPPTALIDVGATRAFTATLRDGRGNAINRTPTWSSTNGAVASIDANGLARGLTAGTSRIDATSGGVTGSATLTVAALPAIGLSATAASFSAVQGGANPAASTIQVTNAGGGNLTGLAATIPGSAPWLTATLSSTTAPSTLTLAANIAGLAAGTYNATVNVASAVASNSPRPVAVTLTVAAAAPTVTTTAATAVNTTGGTVNGTVNPNGNATNAWFEWSPDANLANFAVTSTQSVGSGNVAGLIAATLTNLATNTTYYYRAAASNAGATVRGNILSFTTQTPASITLSAASASFSAVQGGANPSAQTVQITNGGGGTLSGLAATVVGISPSWLTASLSNTTAPSTLTLSVSTAGLGAGTYNASVNIASPVASNSPQTVSVTLTVTPGVPVVVTTAATNLTTSSATLNGTVNPNGLSTTAFFEWGTSPTLTTFNTTLGTAVGSGTTAVPASAALGNLAAGATYYFRMAATSSAGTARGNIVSFTTPATPPSIALSPTSITFNAFPSTSGVPPQTVDITNGGGGTLSGLSVLKRLNQSWLNISLSSTTAPSDLTLSVNTSGLPTGIYIDTVQISSPVATNSPRYVGVTLRNNIGTVRVTTSTTGNSTDPDGYNIVVDHGGPTVSAILKATDQFSFTNIYAGTARVSITGLAGQCFVSDTAGTIRSVTVTANAITDVVFNVSCIIITNQQGTTGKTPTVIKRLY